MHYVLELCNLTQKLEPPTPYPQVPTQEVKKKQRVFGLVAQGCLEKLSLTQMVED